MSLYVLRDSSDHVLGYCLKRSVARKRLAEYVREHPPGPFAKVEVDKPDVYVAAIYSPDKFCGRYKVHITKHPIQRD